MLRKVWRRYANIAVAVLFIPAALSGCTKEEEKVSTSTEVPPGFIVTTEELAALLNQQNVVIVDSRTVEDYQKYHIPRAVNIPKIQFRDPETLKEILEYKNSQGFFIQPEIAEKIFSETGIDANTRVIVYDSITFPDASGIWALLRYYGHDNVQVLKGGFEKWVSEGRSVTSELPKVQKKTFLAKPRPELVASREWILHNKENIIILDMRSFEEYVGVDPAGNPRGGHVPGAISMEWLQLAGNETVVSLAKMQEILNEAGVTKDKKIITYCNIGYGRSTYGLFVLEMLGYDARVYGGSFEDWSNATDLQVTTTEIGSFRGWSTNV